MQDLGLWVGCQGALEIMVLCSYTNVFSWRDTKQKSNGREVLKAFYESKSYFVTALMCHDLFKSSRLEMCKEKKKKLAQTLGIPVVNTIPI